MSKDRIYLGNLLYPGAGVSFPLNIGYVAETLKQYLPNQFEIELFINPKELEHAIEHAPPRILALANYVWHRNINRQMIRYAKDVSASTITVLGGPSFARSDTEWLSNYFETHPFLDFYVDGEGEWKFLEIAKQGIKHGYDVNLMKPYICKDVFFHEGETFSEGTRLLEHADLQQETLDQIPSPYLNGTMDKFFDNEELAPMIETVRGCPYACTFCCWGGPSVNKLRQFSVERVKAEVDYIAEKSRNRQSKWLIMSDGNFGIIKRDLEIAQHIRKTSDTCGWPDKIYLYFAKNSNDRVVEIAAELRDSITVSLARQTMDPAVLKNVKRSNIDLQTLQRIEKLLKKSNVESMIELIYPLPGETKESFLNGIAALFEEMDISNVEIRFYPLALLPGAEIATKESKEKYGFQTAWRILPGHNGKFDKISSCEYEEMVVSTNTFELEDYYYIRQLHFFICLFVTYKIYKPVMALYLNLKQKKSFIRFIDNLIVEIHSEDGVLRELLMSLDKAAQEELLFTEQFPVHEKLYDYKEKEQKRLNIFYIFEILYGNQGKYRYEFNQLIRKIFVEELHTEHKLVMNALESIEQNLVDFIQMEDNLNLGVSQEKVESVSCDTYVEKQFTKYYSGNLTESLDRMYYLTYPGHLGRVVLMSPYS
jgi:putative methyltransferase